MFKAIVWSLVGLAVCLITQAPMVITVLLTVATAVAGALNLTQIWRREHKQLICIGCGAEEPCNPPCGGNALTLTQYFLGPVSAEQGLINDRGE